MINMFALINVSFSVQIYYSALNLGQLRPFPHLRQCHLTWTSDIKREPNYSNYIFLNRGILHNIWIKTTPFSKLRIWAKCTNHSDRIRETKTDLESGRQHDTLVNTLNSLAASRVPSRERVACVEPGLVSFWDFPVVSICDIDSVAESVAVHSN